MQGKHEKSIECYLRLTDKNPSPALEAGRRIHGEVAAYINEHKSFPEYLPSIPLRNPVTEESHIISFSDFFDFKGIFDVRDEDMLYELKTGVQDSLEWASTYQLPLYFVICQVKHIPIERAYLIHFNQYTRTHDFCIVHNTHTARKRAINLIESIGPEIYDYFQKEGVL